MSLKEKLTVGTKFTYESPEHGELNCHVSEVSGVANSYNHITRWESEEGPCGYFVDQQLAAGEGSEAAFITVKEGA